MRRVIAVALLGVLSVVTAACSDDGGAPQSSGGQRELNSVIVGSYDELSGADSAAVSAIGLELVALAGPLQQWFDATGDRAAFVEEMTAAVDRIDARLTPDRAPEVLTTFTPYVSAWRDLLAALAVADLDAYDVAIARLRQLDQIRIDRVTDAYGAEEAQRLLEEEGVAPDR